MPSLVRLSITGWRRGAPDYGGRSRNATEIGKRTQMHRMTHCIHTMQRKLSNESNVYKEKPRIRESDPHLTAAAGDGCSRWTCTLPANQFSVHLIVLIRAGEGDTTSYLSPDYVHKPRQYTCTNTNIHVGDQRRLLRLCMHTI